MGETTNIQWAEMTNNFWQGCKKVSAGCKFCYMWREVGGRFGKDPSIVIRSAPATFNKPLHVKEPKRIFVNSWSDFFTKEADAWRDEAWEIMRKTPHHTYMILTKRIERAKAHLPADWGKGYPNVWIGVSVENKKSAAFRIPKLYEIPAKVRFLSVEPLLEDLDISPYLTLTIPGEKAPIHPIHWVIVGGESGNDNGDYKYRACHQKWIHRIVKDAQAAEVPVFVKQLGTEMAKQYGLSDRHGGDIEEMNFPQYLKVREFPNRY